ncbi:flavin-dependent dehydrogenase [Litoreibacter halocynthiae]|uniref:Flavin-dependent dehydrogenase n=1 Tax=Litoreibacter halocynthiae TaxID=1242689 RepID=A0A4R7LF11_9RHOB|nr:NAD(P)/FAD-dependent oxidoreductase [Litoreibacter halocynthiae]TDT73874.1 flavin-dependent dehydrogenase [Litoreibacter halocynthiae]
MASPSQAVPNTGMMDRVDTEILIVGGGPAGLSVASTLPQDISAILVHQDRSIGTPVRTSGGCWMRDVNALGIPAEFAHPVHHADIYSDNEHLKLDMSSDPVGVLNVTALYRWLAGQSRADIRCGTKYLGTRREGGKLISRLRENRVEYEIASRVIVDASGWHCAVLQSLGLSPPPDRRGIGIEYEFAAPSHDPDRAALFFGSATPTGYGWAFPSTLGSLRLGVGLIEPDSDQSPKALMEGLLASNAMERMGLPRPQSFHVNAGILPSVPFTSDLIFDGVIRVGDSANMATPTLGEGIRICIEHGRTLGAALGKNSPKALTQWERIVRRKLALQYRIGFEANRRAAAYTPRDWDRSVARMRTLPPEELLRFFQNDFSARMIAQRGAQSIGRKIGRMLGGR